MQENSNFETIINTWRSLSGETQFKKLPSMSGDSSNPFPSKIEEEPSDNRTPTFIGGLTTAAAVQTNGEESNDNSESLPSIKDVKEEADDEKEPFEKNNDYLENESVIIKPPSAFDEKSVKDKLDDNVDSVFLRPPPAHKVRSNMSAQEEDSCGIKCLYYTLQCCDCVLM